MTKYKLFIHNFKYLSDKTFVIYPALCLKNTWWRSTLKSSHIGHGFRAFSTQDLMHENICLYISYGKILPRHHDFDNPRFRFRFPVVLIKLTRPLWRFSSLFFFCKLQKNGSSEKSEKANLYWICVSNIKYALNQIRYRFAVIFGQPSI